uniref:Gag-like protein n=1 Tax=Neurospora crassa TaxID=5141 RepID=Q01374_NEUCS|nr:gag-like protein [Neurospora crassa]
MSCDERSDGVVSSLPMAIDGGARGLENSVHNPLAEISACNDPEAALTAKTSDKTEEDDETLKKFIARANKSTDYDTVSTEDRRWARELLLEFAKARVGKSGSTRPEADKAGTDQFVTRKDFDDLKKDILKEIKKGAQEAPKRWADVVAKASPSKIGATLQQPPTTTKKFVPSNLERQLTIKGATIAAEFVNRSNEDTKTTLATCLGKKKPGLIVRAATRMPTTGDYVIVFDEPTRTWCWRNQAWAKEVFGPDAFITMSTVGVLVRGVPWDSVDNYTTAEAISNVAKERNPEASIIRVRPWKRRDGESRGLLLVEVATASAACFLQDNLFLWDGGAYPCEPFQASSNVQQCFRCWGIGHTARFCRQDDICARCGEAKHEGDRFGEVNCPSNDDKSLVYCKPCGKKGHCAYNRKECPILRKAIAKASVAHAERPRAFAPARTQPERCWSRRQRLWTRVSCQTPPPAPVLLLPWRDMLEEAQRGDGRER